MALEKRINWILSSIGIATAAISIGLLLSTVAFADSGCNAGISCPNGNPIACACVNGTCTSDAKCVTCNCNPTTASDRQCCKADEFD